MSSAIYFNMEQSKILSSGNGLMQHYDKTMLGAVLFNSISHEQNLACTLGMKSLLTVNPLPDDKF